MGVQGPPMSSKQRLEAPLCLARIYILTHAHTHRLPSEETQEQDSDSGALSAPEQDGKTNNAIVCMCDITQLHACTVQTHIASRQTTVGTITVNTDGGECQVYCFLIEHNYLAVFAVSESERQRATDHSHSECTAFSALYISQ